MSRGREALPLPDQAIRDRIREQLGRNLLVEAAAGTGKTRSLISRMTSLIAGGQCPPEHMAAVTFTRKAASELRLRLQGDLAEAAGKAREPERGRLQGALARLEACFVGTIHSFCARLLRERPVEAGVPVDFAELDEAEDDLMLRRGWEEFLAVLHATDDPLLARLDALGLEPGDLLDSFLTFAAHPDIGLWPAPEVPPPDTAGVAKALRAYVAHMEDLLPSFANARGDTDRLMPAYGRIVRAARQADLDSLPEVMELLGDFRRLRTKQADWPEGQKQGKAEKERWEAFLEEWAEPLKAAWLEHRYPAVLELYRRAGGWTAEQRLRSGRLNFQDLLLLAAALLRRSPEARRYFSERFSHILVDEFQDTDPIQAEVLLLLAAGDPREADWRRSVPRPGSLFFVGDPKQSIYRFRRADIVTYNEVRRIILDTGGEVVELAVNFRSVPALVDWVNGVFEERFPSRATPASPAYVKLLSCARKAWRGRPAPPGGSLAVLRSPPELARNKEVVAWEAAAIAGAIRARVAAGARPADFLVISYGKRWLGEYARALGSEGLPHEVSGGTALNSVRELALLRTGLAAAARPEDPVAMVAALRSELFGLPDSTLYRYRRAGGRFARRASVPEGLPPEDAAQIGPALDRLRLYGEWLSRKPPVAALEMMAADLGLFASAAAGEGGLVRSGSLGKALEILRASQAESWTAADMLDELGRIVSGEEPYDGLAARPLGAEPVRVMNLHKVKGLEAPEVFLACPAGESSHPVELHVDRSGEQATGYLPIYGPRWGRQRRLLAQPPGWDELCRVEREFLEAEKVRLLYVAATRAGARLTLTLRADKGRRSNPWQFFADALRDAPPQEVRPQVPVPVPPAPPVGPEEAPAAAADIAARWAAALAPTWEAGRAKELALGGPPARPAGRGEEHGTEWGAVIHALLETALRKPGADLSSQAAALLLEQGLDPARAAEAAELVRMVEGSDFWRRASAADRRLAEVPFEVAIPAGTPPAGELPLLLKGVIDLAFREERGWVVVDYKTDDRPGEPLGPLAERYAPQVRLYAEVWARLTGEPVSEAALYFVRSGRLVVL